MSITAPATEPARSPAGFAARVGRLLTHIIFVLVVERVRAIPGLLLLISSG